MQENNLHLSEEAKQEILEIHNIVTKFLDLIISDMTINPDNSSEFLSEAQTKGNWITHLVKESRTKHLARVERGKASPIKSLIYTDMLTSYRRIKDHILNIAEGHRRRKIVEPNIRTGGGSGGRFRIAGGYR